MGREDYVTESPPDKLLVLFRLADDSWHAHHPHEGQRRVLQVNWLTSGTCEGFPRSATIYRRR